MTTAQKVYQQLLLELTESDEEEKKAIAKFLLAEKYGISSVDILLDQPISPISIKEDVGRLNAGEPIQYVVGQVVFANHLFYCGPGALIPRPETEELVYEVQKRGPFTSILDIGTGTGCIAHSLALAYPQSRVEAWDVSEEAIQWAEKNKNRLNTRVHIRQVDVLIAPSEETESWDLIVSNPPYILPSEKKMMHSRVYDYEPTQALFVPETNPLLFYEIITQRASVTLKENGLLAFEINQGYGKEVVSLLEKFSFRQIELLKDIPGRDRMVFGRR